MRPMDDDRSFGEQLSDLGVDVVKRKSEGLKNIKWLSSRGKAAALIDKISINKNSISIGTEVYQMLIAEGTGEKVQFAVAEYRGVKVLVISPHASGYKISKYKDGYTKTGSPAMIKKILSHDLPLGRYRVKKAKGGVICIPEGGQ